MNIRYPIYEGVYRILTPVPLFCLPLRNQVNHFSSQSNAALFCSRWGLRLCLCLLDGEEINDYLQE